MDYEIVVYGLGGFGERETIGEEESSLHNICLGEIVGSNKLYCVRLSEILRHVLIVGTTGSGKTTTASIICKNVLNKGKTVVVFDWNGEYFEVLQNIGVEEKYIVVFNKNNPLRINPFEHSRHSDYEEYVEQIIDILENVLQLTPPQTYFLYQTFAENKDIRSFSSLLEKLSENPFYVEGYSGREARFALIRKIRMLTFSSAKRVFATTNDLEKIFNSKSYSPKIFIVDLSWITNVTLKKLYSLFLLKAIFDRVSLESRNHRGILKYLVIIDEAHNILTENNELLQRVFSEIRKFGAGLVAISQSISEMPNYVLRNTNIKIFHTIRSFKDIKEISGLMPPNVNIQNILISLNVGEALIYDNFSKYPVKVIIKAQN